MILTRTAVRIVKPLWSSATARYSGLSKIRCTGRWFTLRKLDNSKRKIFGLFKKKQDPLALFVGTWYETETENFDGLLREAGIDEDLIEPMKQLKSWITFGRDDDEWLCYSGVLKMEGYRRNAFKLGQYSHCSFINGAEATCVIEQKGNALVEKYETINEPVLVMEIERKIKDKNKMITKLTLNKVVSTRKFKRIMSDDEHREIIGFLM